MFVRKCPELISFAATANFVLINRPIVALRSNKNNLKYL